jgi:hypothetical protein
MRMLLSFSIVLGLGLMGAFASQAKQFWREVKQENAPSKTLMPFSPSAYKVYQADDRALKTKLFSLSANPDEAELISLPLPDGTFRDFRVWEVPVMGEKLASKYPNIKTFTAVAIGDPTVSGKLDYTEFGFHAMIFDGESTCFIDPYDRFNDGFYFAHYKRDETRAYNERMQCQRAGHTEQDVLSGAYQPRATAAEKTANRTANGWTLRTYRLALSANNFYCRAATGSSTPTLSACLSAMTTSLNRVNGVYERELSVHMNFIDNEDTLIWTTATGGPNGADPFNSINSNGPACLTMNQTVCDARVRTPNYDLGHVFTTGGGGISSLGVVCNSRRKAQSVTGSPRPVGDGFDIDYVAHEMGHEFGSEHTFNNNNDGSCDGNAAATSAYEPGGGATLMDYAGICTPDDLQRNSDAYFNASSLKQIYGDLSTSQDVCAVKTSTGNKLVSLAAYTASYVIPYKTPFELIGPTAVDSVADTLTTYCWSQMNLGDFGARFINTFRRGPIFRSYTPVKIPVRVFPKVSMVLSGVLSNAGATGNQGEKAPDTTRFLTFRMTVRNIYNGYGCFLIPDDTVHIDAMATPSKAGFRVTSQNSTGVNYNGGTNQTVTWDVVGTDNAPVNAANVDIFASVDGGFTWAYYLGTYPNNGSASVRMPNPAATSSQARLKVKGSGNVFFNVNSRNFTLNRNGSLPTTPTSVAALESTQPTLSVYPNPATHVINIETGITTAVTTSIFNTVGQEVWSGMVTTKATIDVQNWPKGVYYVRMAGAGQLSAAPVVVQ